jgi:beta-glucosidase
MPSNQSDVKQFPSSFRFGVADADLQVIGEKYTRAEEQSERTMWSYFAETSGKCFQNQGPEEGVDRYHLWEQDIELMKQLGIKHYRTSVSMNRILKENGDVNQKAVAWYTNYFKGLKNAGISIYATLYHWELPLYLHKIGGWKNRKTVEIFVKHASAVVKYLGEYIDEYFILNEPWCASMLSYHIGGHAPGETDLHGAIMASHHLLLAQGMAFRALKAIDKHLPVSTVVNVETSYAYSPDKKNIEAARHSDGYFNRWFLDPLYLGTYPEDMVRLYGNAMPKISNDDLKTIAVGKDLLTLGINYYCGRIIAHDPKAPLGYAAKNVDGAEVNDLGWPIFVPPYYPEGLYDILQQLYYSYHSYGLKRMYITENGMALKTSIKDQRRVEYYQTHISQVYKAITRGIPVAGYFAWTLMDNYEWAEGYRPKSCFGMVHVDRKTMKRIPKSSALWYAGVMKTNSLPAIGK